MPTQHAVIDIAAPQDAVWRVVSSVPTWPEWMEEVKSVSTTTPAGGVGAVYELDQGVAGLGIPLTARVVTADAPTTFAVEQRQTGLTTVATYRLTALDAHTTRVETTHESVGAVSGAVGALAGGSYTRLLESALTRLKDLCEQPA